MNFLVFPYRDGYFYRRFGPVVRDLQMLEALRRDPRVDEILVVNRPVSVYERISKRRPAAWSLPPGVQAIDTTSADLLGPLQKRAWTETAYDGAMREIVSRVGKWKPASRVLLDFTPIAKLRYEAFGEFRIWYDHIDNFTKHHRFMPRHRRLAKEKYRLVHATADLVTGVTPDAMQGAPAQCQLCIPNGILNRSDMPPGATAPFTFGFVGFITEKFDVDMVARLVEGGRRTAAIYGEVLDRSTGRALSSLRGVTLQGRFTGKDIPRVLSTFRIGLLPYRPSLSHDGSPIKLYQYLDAGRPVIASRRFDSFDSPFVCIDDPCRSEQARAFVDTVIAASAAEGDAYAARVRDALPPGVTWAEKITVILDRLQLTLRTASYSSPTARPTRPSQAVDMGSG